MKSFFSLSTLSATLLFSSLAFGDVPVSRGSLSQKLSLNTSALIFSQSFSDIHIVTNPIADSIEVSVNLVGESDSKVESYMKSWGLNVSGTKFVNLSISPTGGFASNSCTRTIRNGRYTKLKGVCVEDVTITVPTGMEPKISSDKMVITLIEDSSSTNEARAIISTESINQLISALEEARFDREKEEVLNNFVQLQSGSGSFSRLLVSDFVRIITPMSFDDSKLIVLRALSPFITERIEAYETLTQLLTFDRSKQEALAILLND